MRRLLLVLASAVLALAVVEAAVRVLWPAAPPVRFTQNVDILEARAHEQAPEVIEHDPELFWRLRPDHVLPDGTWMRGRIANGQGFREDHEVPLAKPPGELRVLFLGDSCTFGSGLDLAEGFVQRTEERLAAALPDARVECINAGVPGYSLFQGWRRLETQGLAFDPDVVVLNFGWNDGVPWDGRGDAEHYEAWRASRPPELLGWSRLAQLLAAEPLPPEPEPAAGEKPRRRRRVTPDEFRSLLERVHLVLRARGVPLVVLQWAAPMNVDPEVPEQARTHYQAAMAEFAAATGAREGVTFVDLVPVARALADEHPVDEIFLDQVHATALANDAYAERIAAALVPLLAP